MVESLFLNFPAKFTNALKQEFYGPYFSLFSDADSVAGDREKNSAGYTPSLRSNLSLGTTTQIQRDNAIGFLKDIVTISVRLKPALSTG